MTAENSNNQASAPAGIEGVSQPSLTPRRNARHYIKGLRKALSWGGRFILKAVAELTAIILGLGVLWFGLLISVMAQGEADVSFLKQNFSLWFAQAYDGQEAEISKFKVQWHPERESLGFWIQDINVKDDTGLTLLTVGSIYTETHISALLNRGFEARRLDLNGGQFTIRRDEDGKISGAIGGPDVFGRLGPIISIAAPEGQKSENLIDAVSLNGTNVFYRDDTVGLSLDFDDVDFRTDISETEILAQGHAKILMKDTSNTSHLDIKVHRKRTGDNALNVSINLAGLNPAHIDLGEGPLRAASAVNIPLMMTTNWRDVGPQARDVHFSISGMDENKNLSWPYIGGLQDFAVEGVWDISSEQVNLNNIDVKTDAINLRGQVQLSNVTRQRLKSASPLEYLINLETLNWAAADILQSPLEISNGTIAGTYLHSSEQLIVDKMSLPISDYTLHLNADLQNVFGHKENVPDYIRLNGRFDGRLSRDDFLHLWPKNQFLGGRNWVKSSVIKAVLSNMAFDVNIPDISQIKGRLPDEAVKLDFTVSDTEVKYIPTMPPIVQVNGHGRLGANSLNVTLDDAQLGELNIKGGSVNIPKFFPYGSDFTLEFEGEGPVPYMVELIDKKPFEYARIYNLSPQDFSGHGVAKLKVTRPLLVFFERERISYDVEVNGSDVSAPFGIGDLKMTEGALFLKADKTGMSLIGPAKVGPFESQINWRENFDFGATPTRLALTCRIDNAMLDKLGMSVREYFGGGISLSVDAIGEGVDFDSAKVSADLTDSELVFGDLWSKSEGRPALMELSISRNLLGQIMIDDLTIAAPGLELDGALKFDTDFRLLEAGLDRVKIDEFVSARVTALREQPNQPMKATLSGHYLNLDGVIDTAVWKGEAGYALPVILTANMNTLRLAPNYELSKASLLYNHTGEKIEQFRFSGASVDGPVVLDLKTSETGPYSNILNFDIANASDAANAFFSIQSLQGGRLYGEAVRPRDGEDLIWSGQLNVDDFKIVDAPLLAQILSLASLDGLGNVLGGGGLEFETVELPFTWGGGVLGLESGRAAGPALGLTGDGSIDIRNKKIDIDGTLIPAYAANSFLGSIPILGDIFGGDADDATLGLTYTVEGAFESAQVGVNPLSALTPGILRKIFKPTREKKRITLPSEQDRAQLSLRRV